MELIFLFWIGLAVVVGVAARTRGRDGTGWGILALIISPLLAGLLLLASPRGVVREAVRDPRWADLRSTPVPSPQPPIPWFSLTVIALSGFILVVGFSILRALVHSVPY